MFNKFLLKASKVVGPKVTRTVGTAVAKISKHSPELLLVAGTVSTITGIVFACKATLKCDEIMAEHEERINRVHESREKYSEEEYTEKEYRSDLFKSYSKTVVSFGRVYAPAIIFTAGGFACFYGSWAIVNARNAALAIAYKELDKKFEEYREETNRKYNDRSNTARGFTERKVSKTVIDDKGKEKTVKEDVIEFNGKVLSPYAVKFGPRNFDFKNFNTELNIQLLHGKQNYCNDMLRATGHIFLNEVYDVIGSPRTPAGNIVGWQLDNPSSDDFVDFGIHLADNTDESYPNDKVIILDFNCTPILESI